MSGAPPVGGARGIWRSTVTRAVLVLLLAGVIVADVASGDHAPTRVAGITALSLLWLVNAWGLARRLRRRR